jgi:hypothetical protein
MSGAHPSDFALDRGGAEVEAHLAGCAVCVERKANARQIEAEFAADVLPRTLGRVRSRLADDRARRRWWTFGGGGGLAAAAAVALLLVRPASPPTPAWDGIKGPAPATTPGVAVFIKRGKDVVMLAPGQPLRPGDAVRFVARLDRPRFLELRARDANGRERTLFPDGPTAAQLRPEQPLPGGFVVDAAPGPERLTVLLGDRAFPVGRTPDGDLQVIHIDLPKEP